jgi:hypothetical protein
MNTDTLSDQPVSPYVIHGVAGLQVPLGGRSLFAKHVQALLQGIRTR